MTNKYFIRWTTGGLLLVISSLALGASELPARGRMAFAVIGALAGAALIALFAAVLTVVRRQRPQLTTTALALIVLTFVCLVCLANGPLLMLLLAAANFVIACRVLRIAIARDRSKLDR